MKRILYAIITAAVLLAGCSDGMLFNPGISFLTPEPEIFEETAIFRVIGQPFESADSVRIPVVFGGTGRMGTDYEASADHFTISGGSPTDSIVITTKQLGTGRRVSLSLEIPEGFTAGKYVTSEFNLQNKYGLLSFASARGYAADTTECFIVLHDSTGTLKALSKDTPVSFKVNTEKSTAVEGVDFKIAATESMYIAGGANAATFRVIPLNAAPKEGKDKIVLNVVTDERFDSGLFPEKEISLLKSELKVLDGSWKIDTLITDSLHFEKFWGSRCTGYSLVPEFSYSDSFEMTLSTALFAPSFASGLKRFFKGESIMEFAHEKDIAGTEGETRKVQLISIDNTNRYFSADTTSTDSRSFIGVRITKEPETETDMLELYILDHTSMSFMPELKSDMKYGSEKPVATEPGLYLNATFLKRR